MKAQDWPEALKVIDLELARVPNNLDALAWRARLLLWSGHAEEAEKLFRELIRKERRDPDLLLGLSSALAQEGRWEEALRALDSATEIDPKRADLRVARARTLRALQRTDEAREEFSRALALNPGNEEAVQGLLTVRRVPKQELRFGSDTDRFNFTGTYEGEWVNLASRWTPHWSTSVGGNFFQRSGASAGKFVASTTARSARWGALTAGGAAGHDDGIIPKSESFFEYGHGWRVSETGFARSVETTYGQHWYWYSAARILTLNGAVTVHLPREWSWTLTGTGARSHFSNLAPGWQPSGTSRLAFPLARWSERRLRGSIFFAAGAEQFALIDQVGSFSSRAWGGTAKFQFSAQQDVTAYAAYQERTAARTQTSFGFSYGIHF